MQQPSVRKEILKTAVITVAALVLACLMIAVIVFFCFPYQGYKLSKELGMNRTALFFAQKYADNGNIDGLVYCVELDEQLLVDTGKEKYANKLIAHTEKIFDYENAYSYFEQLDEYYISNSLPQTHVGLYSYYEYIVSSNYAARAVVGKDGEMIFRGKPTELSKMFVSDITTEEKAIIYMALSKAMSQGNVSYDLLAKDGSFTQFYYSLHDSVATMIVSLESETDQLRTLFLMRSALYLIDEIVMFFEAHEIDVTTEWNGFLDYQYNGKSLKTAYTDMFLDYIINE